MSRSIVAITGASGFLGRALVARALAAGKRVRGLDLVPDHEGSPSIELLRGDVSDPAACAALCAGAEIVYHTAAVVRESGPMALFERVNVGGTGAMLVAARRAGVRHFVMISSVMVHGFDFPDGVPEDGPTGGFDNPYCATKIRSEALALAAHEPGVFDVYVVRPGDVYGPGSIPWTERPGPLVLRAVSTLDRAASVLGRELEMNREAVRYVLRRGQYGIERIKALGYTPRIGLDEGMARSVAWLREKGIGRSTRVTSRRPARPACVSPPPPLP